MKKVFTLMLLFFMTVYAGAEAKRYDLPFFAASPRVMGAGGAYTANAKGLDAFFYNPAGFSAKEGELTLLGLSGEFIGNVFPFLNSDDPANMQLDDPDVLKLVIDQIVKAPEGRQFAGGMGFNPAASFGYAGKNWGVGVIMNMDYEVYGETLSGTEANGVVTAGVLLGYSLPINLGLGILTVGGSVRPMYRIRAEYDNETMMILLKDSEAEVDSQVKTLYGWGYGLDLGATLEMGSLKVGVAVKDIMGTRFEYKEATLEEYMKLSDPLEGPDATGDPYEIPMTVNAGFSYNPSLGFLNAIIDPVISADYRMVLSDVTEYQGHVFQETIWSNVSAGIDLALLSGLVSVRAGINQGYLTAGVGVDIWIIEIHGALYSKEKGAYAGSRQQMGAILEIALRL